MFRLPKPNRSLDVPPPRRSPRERTTTVESLLGMLSLRPMSGYDLRSTIARTIGNCWQESFGQIYPALRRMEQEDLVEVVPIEGIAQRGRKVYRLTEKGHKRLVEWLGMPCDEQVMRNELLLKVFFGRLGPPGAVVQHVREHRERMAENLERYRALEKILPVNQKGDPGLPYFMMALRHGLISAEAALRWSDETIAALEAMQDGVPRHGEGFAVEAGLDELEELAIKGE